MKKKKINNKKGFFLNKYLGCYVLNEFNLDVFGGIDIFDIWYYFFINELQGILRKGFIKYYDY